LPAGILHYILQVAIARAVLRKSPIMILDEATSALDNKSERLVQQALDKLIQHENCTAAAKSRTIIVIAHRLSTVRNADRIVVLGSPSGTSTTMTGSVILEQGSHNELMQLEKGFYRALVGTGAKSSGLVDDTNKCQKGDDDDTGTDAASMKDKVDAATGRKSEFESGKAEAASGFAAFFGKKDEKEAKKEAEEKKKLAENKARLWDYTRPEMLWILCGSSASIVKGSIFPLLSIVFTKMIAVFYDSDTDYMVDQSRLYSFVFYGLAFLCLLTEFLQKSIFEMVGEKLTKRLRGDLFRSILRKDISWFEDEANAIGVLASRLSTDVKLVRVVTGQQVAATLESVSALTTGIIISSIASWEMFLIMLAMIPALGISEALQFMAMKSSEGTIRDQLSKSTDKLHEAVTGIREVQSFMLQHVVVNDIGNRIEETITPASKKTALFKGTSLMLCCAALTFCMLQNDPCSHTPSHPMHNQ
jgi:ATP-binding cassette, subfamily B (MDR/TAP), member 1